MIKQLQFLLISLISSVSVCSAWKYNGGWGFGVSPSLEHQQLFVDANQHPNVTKLIPGIWFGPFTVAMRINITELTPTGADTNIQNPRVVNTVYSLEWKGGENINETVQYKDFPPRLCANYPLGLFPANVTNDFDSTTGHDCSSALGHACWSALLGTSYEWTSSCLSGFYFPKECDAYELSSGGVGSTALTDPSTAYADAHNLTSLQRMHHSPYGFAFWASDIYEAGDTTAYERETERLHMMVFTSKGTVPVCARVNDDHVSPGGPASGAESGWTGSIYLVISIALAVIAWLQ